MQGKKVNTKVPTLIILTLVFSLLFILPNDYKHLIPYGDIILNVCTLTFVGIVYLVYFPSIIKFISKNILFLVPFIIVLIASYLNDGNVVMAIYKIVCMFIFYFIGTFFRKYRREFIRIAELIVFAILAINACVVIVYGSPLAYSDSGGRIFFIFEGDISKLLISEMLLFFIGYEMGVVRHKFFHYIVFAASLYSIIFSSTGFLGALTMFIFMIFVSRKKMKKNIFKLSFLYVVVLMGINILAVFDFLSPALAKIFDKSVTLSGRTEIWKAAIGVIEEHPLIGIGEYSPSFFINLTGVRGATHAHNQVIQILLNSGIVGFTVYIYYAFKLAKLTRVVGENPLAVYYLVYLLTIVTLCVTALPFNNFFILSVLIVVNLLRYNNEHGLALDKELGIC